MRKMFILVGLCFAAACSYPAEKVLQGGADPTVAFAGAPPGAIVEIDGLDRGQASLYDGRKQALSITPGRHIVIVRRGGAVLLEREVVAVSGSAIVLNLQ